MLTKAMEMLLKADEKETWHVIRFPESACISALVEQVQKSKPDLVILYPSMPEDASDPLLRLFEKQPALKVIANQPESKVITVNLENNEMQVYSKHSITVRHASDLLSVIEDRYFSNHPI